MIRLRVVATLAVAHACACVPASSCLLRSRRTLRALPLQPLLSAFVRVPEVHVGLHEIPHPLLEHLELREPALGLPSDLSPFVD